MVVAMYGLTFTSWIHNVHLRSHLVRRSEPGLRGESQQIVAEPFAIAAVSGSYDVIARIHGGGVTGQAGALRLGVARCLNFVDEEASRPGLKKAGMLTRDSRIKERKKAGLKKARKAPQYSKR